jgi:hypothetical protein
MPYGTLRIAKRCRQFKMKDIEFKILASHDNGKLSWKNNPDWIEWEEYRDVLTSLEKNRIIEQSETDPDIFLLTEYGRNNLTEEGKSRKESEKDKEITRKKLRNEAKISGFKKWTSWAVFAIFLLGFIYKTIEFISSQSNEENKMSTGQNDQQSESELSKSHILTSDQKNQDSLHQTNSDKNISNP